MEKILELLPIIGGVLGLLSIPANIFISIYRAQAQNASEKYKDVVDDSAASVNFRTLVIALQADAVGMRKEIENLKALIESAHLDVTISIKLDSKPEIVGWGWRKGTEKIESVSP